LVRGVAWRCAARHGGDDYRRRWVTDGRGRCCAGVKLSEASKMFAKKFSCGASVVPDATGRDQIDVQGDVGDELAEFIAEKLSIDEDDIVVLDDSKKK
jgi:density-regulated protein